MIWKAPTPAMIGWLAATPVGVTTTPVPMNEQSPIRVGAYSYSARPPDSDQRIVSWVSSWLPAEIAQ